MYKMFPFKDYIPNFFHESGVQDQPLLQQLCLIIDQAGNALDVILLRRSVSNTATEYKGGL